MNYIIDDKYCLRTGVIFTETLIHHLLVKRYEEGNYRLGGKKVMTREKNIRSHDFWQSFSSIT